MTIIKHASERTIDVKYFYMTCPCGCEFIATDHEFTRVRDFLNSNPHINCPECNTVLLQTNNGVQMPKEEAIKLQLVHQKDRI